MSTPVQTTSAPASSAPSVKHGTATVRLLAVLRVVVGFVFLWAFLDKAFGLGFSTPAAKSWIHGGTPTTGYLKSLQGPFAAMLQPMAGQAWVDWAFMLGMLLVGAALVVGIALPAAAFGGTILLALLWASGLPLQTNPFVDEHVVYAIVLWVLVTAKAGHAWGLGRIWSSSIDRIGTTWLK
ncbi:hypothetical protein J7E83_20285 [Arthrobacter sp. ISL-48]|uniref:hypothetical protein n=1 Tax=Arthrobacter sp. ISL-48 TaxID=2819110 RepID=UPI001BE6E227|nr:hypothetical protein [Arthrobacter sp. ISL-48]MBT2534424.1 hypothetical protein [Arthrobacter sp. ISL-48]